MSQIKKSDPNLSERIEHLVLKFEKDSFNGGYCFHLNHSGNVYNQEEFARVLYHTLPMFALTEDEYEQYKSSPSELFRLSFDRITKNDSASDFGEAILYLVLDHFFDVPKFVTKVRIKSAEKVPVFGFDCAHVSKINGVASLWLGEAKLKKDFSDAADDAFESIEKFLELAELKAQMRLMRPHIEINKDQEPELHDFISKITREVTPIGSFNIRVPILLATNSSVARDAESQAELLGKLEAECTRRFKALEARNWKLLDNITLDFILFPLSNKDDFVDILKEYKT